MQRYLPVPAPSLIVTALDGYPSLSGSGNLSEAQTVKSAAAAALHYADADLGDAEISAHIRAYI
jgi:hypothetical protein